MAVDIRLASCKRQDQSPLLEAAVFYLLLYSGLRESVLVNLNLDQYKDDALLNIRRKGQRISKKILLPKEAALHVNNYLADAMRNANDPLFTNKHGVHIAQRLSGNVSIKEIFRYAKPSADESMNVVEALF